MTASALGVGQCGFNFSLSPFDDDQRLSDESSFRHRLLGALPPGSCGGQDYRCGTSEGMPGVR